MKDESFVIYDLNAPLALPPVIIDASVLKVSFDV